MICGVSSWTLRGARNPSPLLDVRWDIYSPASSPQVARAPVPLCLAAIILAVQSMMVATMDQAVESRARET